MTSRAELPGKICALLGAPANVAVHGSPGSGKSWIADRVLNCMATASEVRSIRVDLSTVQSGRDVFREVVLACATDPPLVFPPHDETVHDAWKFARRAVSGTSGRVVLVLDQFDRVLHFPDAQEFLLLLRELVHRPESLHCTTLILSRRSLQAIEETVRGISTLASVCYSEYLGSIDSADLAALGPGSGGLSPAEVEDCLQWAGGHPALAKYWLATRPDRNPDPSSEMEVARVALRVLDHLRDLQLLDAAAQLVLGPVVKDLLFERRELELLGVMPTATSGERPRAALASQEVFRDALRHRTWNMDPWGVLGLAEVRLRGVIDTALNDAYGAEWPSVVLKKSKAATMAWEEAHAKMDRDSRMFGRTAPWLSYTYPGDLWAIIQVEWDVFSTVFSSRDKAYWRTVLTGLSQYRAPLAHGRPEVLGEAQITQCRIYAEQVLQSISTYEANRWQGSEAG